jgi:hypothetical protein
MPSDDSGRPRARCSLTALVLFAVVLGTLLGARPAETAPAAPPTATFLGPKGLIARPATLRASARVSRGRVVAVTFFVDGKPLGSDTVAPYTQDVNPGLLRPGRHRLRLVAVDNLGRRGSTTAVLRTGRYQPRFVTASPGHGLTAALAALRQGDVTVRLAPGRYRLNEARLGSGARLLGSGPRTVIEPSGAAYWALLVAKGQGIRIADLTIDGGGRGPGEGIAVAVFDGSSHVRLQRLHMRRVRKFGVNVWGAHANVSIQDSRIESIGGAHSGVFALGSDESRDTSVIRTRVRGFRSFGILLAQREYGRPSAALHGLALDNEISDIRDPARDACAYAPRTTPRCGTNEGGIWTGGVEAAIIGNTVRRARWDGIQTVGSSTRTTIVRNDIRGTRTGIYVERSTNHSLVSRNLIVDVGTGINVEWRHGGGGSSDNSFTFNRIVSARRSGLFADVGADRNRIIRNVFLRGARPAIVLQGSSHNVLRHNRGCGTNGDLIREQSANFEDGGRARPTGNHLVANKSTESCVAH